MKKTIIQAVIFSLIILILFFGGQLLVGGALIYAFVPSPDHTYDNVKYISNEVTVGSLIGSPLTLIVTLLTTFIAGMTIFIIGKSVIIRLRKKNS